MLYSRENNDMKPGTKPSAGSNANYHPRFRVLAGCLWLASLAGCAVGPDFSQPAAPEVDTYSRTALAEQTVASPGRLGEAQQILPGLPVDAQWWRAFQSDELNALIARAFVASPTLDRSRATLTQAQELLGAYSGSMRLPQVQGAAGAQRMQTSPSSQGLTGEGRQFSLYTASVGVVYNLDIAGGIRRQEQAYAARADLRQYELQAAELTLAGNIATTAISRAQLAAQQEATSSILKAQDEQLRHARQRVRLGSASPDEALSLAAQVEQTRAQLPVLEKKMQQADYLLAVLAGQAPAAATVPEFTLSDFSLPQKLPLRVPSELVRRRPDIQAAEAAMRAENAEYGVALSRLYPQLNISASAGALALSAGALFGPGTAVWGLLGQLTQTLFDAGLPAQSRAAKAAFEAAAANYQSVVLQAMREVADALQAVNKDAQALSAMTAADAASAAAVQSVRRQFDLGVASSIELLVVQQQAQQIRVQQVAAQAQRLANTVALFMAMGGGDATDSGNRVR